MDENNYSQCLLFVVGLAASMTLTLGAVVNTVPAVWYPGYLMNNPSGRDCLVLCDEDCNLRNQTCVDIPGEVVCENNLAHCKSFCGEMCTCLNGCAAQCLQQPCFSSWYPECQPMRMVCYSTCQLRCPGYVI